MVSRETSECPAQTLPQKNIAAQDRLHERRTAQLGGRGIGSHGLLVFIRVCSWLTAMQNKTANAPAFAQTCGAAGANRHELLLQNEV